MKIINCFLGAALFFSILGQSYAATVDFNDLPGTAIRLVNQLMPSVVNNNRELITKKNQLDADVKAIQ